MMSIIEILEAVGLKLWLHQREIITIRPKYAADNSINK